MHDNMCLTPMRTQVPRTNDSVSWIAPTPPNLERSSTKLIDQSTSSLFQRHVNVCKDIDGHPGDHPRRFVGWFWVWVWQRQRRLVHSSFFAPPFVPFVHPKIEPPRSLLTKPAPVPVPAAEPMLTRSPRCHSPCAPFACSAARPFLVCSFIP